MNNQRPISRKKIQLLVIVTILFWATQTLLHQWGYGAESPASDGTPVEKFVPNPSHPARASTLELRAEATVRGKEVRLKQVCRWSEADAGAFAQIGELVIARVIPRTPFKTISIDEIRQTLHDAGVNLGMIRFAGPVVCTVNRSDVEYNSAETLDQWIAVRQAGGPPAASAPATQPASDSKPDAATPAAPVSPEGAAVLGASRDVNPAASRESALYSLRDLLTRDLAVRLGIAREDLQINFNPADQKVLNLSEPQFKFNLDGRNIHNLGQVSWQVQIVTESGSKKVEVTADARAWQNQLTVIRPLAIKQILRPADVQERRMLSDRVPDEPLLTAEQAVGQQAARDLKSGTILSARMVDPVPLVHSGQFVTITLAQGNVRIKTVARAIDGGAFGQTIKVKNEATNEIYEVVITGPQEGTVGPVASPVASIKDE